VIDNIFRDEWIKVIKDSIGKGNATGSNGQSKKITVTDFDLLHVIGKGSFGKVFFFVSKPLF
jgi:hypothetical protein